MAIRSTFEKGGELCRKLQTLPLNWFATKYQAVHAWLRKYCRLLQFRPCRTFLTTKAIHVACVLVFNQHRYPLLHNYTPTCCTHRDWLCKHISVVISNCHASNHLCYYRILFSPETRKHSYLWWSWWKPMLTSLVKRRRMKKKEENKIAGIEQMIIKLMLMMKT